MGKILVIISTVAAIFISVQTGFAAQMSVIPTNQTVLEGENFTVNISVDPEGSEVAGVQYELYFDNTLLKALDQDRGPFLRQDGKVSNVYKNEFNNTNGKIKYSEARRDTEKVGGVTNPCVLATITFQAIAEHGTSKLHFEIVKLCDQYANPLATEVNNGMCKIKAVEHTPTPTPTPASTLTPTSGDGNSGDGEASVIPTPTPTQTSSPTPEQTVTLTKTPILSPDSTITPTPSAVVTSSPTPVSISPSEEWGKLPGFEAILSIIALLTIYLSFRLRKGGDENE